MSIFKGKEELDDMYKSDVINMMKDIVYPYRTKGGMYITEETNTVQRKTWQGEWYDYELTSRTVKELSGTDMSWHQPKIDGKEYTWGNLKTYPAPLLKVLAYRLWLQKYGSEEE